MPLPPHDEVPPQAALLQGRKSSGGWSLYSRSTAVREGIHYFGPMARAYRASRRRDLGASPVAARDARFAEVEGAVTDVGYRLESAERGEDRTVAHDGGRGGPLSEVLGVRPLGNRRVAQTRPHVEMSEIEGRWVVTDLGEEATVVRDPSSVAAETKASLCYPSSR